MSDRHYDFVQVDVFARTRFAGNPLAIFGDASGLSDNEMQAIAREMNLSETTFILPRDPQIEAREGTRVRIFTVEEELPFAGHPTLGTALYLSALRPSEEIVLDLNVGKVPVRFTADSKIDNSQRVDGKVFGEMCQRDPEFGSTLSRDEVARVVGLDPDEIDAERPIQVVSTGLQFAIVPVRNLKALTNIKPDVNRAAAFLEGTGARFFISSVRRRREKCARECFFTAAKIRRPDRQQVVLRRGWRSTESADPTSKC